jgi:hypothetical protein
LAAHEHAGPIDERLSAYVLARRSRTVGDDELDEMPVVLYEAYNPATDEAPPGGDTDCDGVDPQDKR